MDKDTIDLWLGWLRHLLTALGGAFVIKGYIDQATVEAVAAAIATIVGFAWSAYVTVQKQKEVKKLKLELHETKMALKKAA